MRCPKCDAPTFVKDSRPKGDSISRRRECTGCGSRFSTMEITVESYLKITRRK